MIEITHVETFGFDGAIRGMRMPYESFDKSDSHECMYHDGGICDFECVLYGSKPSTSLCIGKADMALAQKLIKAGPEHRKFLRMIHVQCDVLAPRYWWQEADKYKWIEANSSSTMHLITKRELTLDDFSLDGGLSESTLIPIMNALNDGIREYNKVEGERKEALFRAIKQLLPESYNQLRTIDTNYEDLLSIYHQRKNHRLTEWCSFCEWLKTLPYMADFLEVGCGD